MYVYLQSSFPSLFVHQSENHVLLYKLNHSDDTSRSVSVSLTIRIYKNMSLSVWINNTKLLQKALDWIYHTQNLLYSSGVNYIILCHVTPLTHLM